MSKVVEKAQGEEKQDWQELSRLLLIAKTMYQRSEASDGRKYESGKDKRNKCLILKPLLGIRNRHEEQNIHHDAV